MVIKIAIKYYWKKFDHYTRNHKYFPSLKIIKNTITTGYKYHEQSHRHSWNKKSSSQITRRTPTCSHPLHSSWKEYNHIVSTAQLIYYRTHRTRPRWRRCGRGWATWASSSSGSCGRASGCGCGPCASACPTPSLPSALRNCNDNDTQTQRRRRIGKKKQMDIVYYGFWATYECIELNGNLRNVMYKV